jgi:hypothetical protein
MTNKTTKGANWFGIVTADNTYCDNKQVRLVWFLSVVWQTDIMTGLGFVDVQQTYLRLVWHLSGVQQTSKLTGLVFVWC